MSSVSYIQIIIQKYFTSSKISVTLVKMDENGLGDRKSMINAAAILDAALHPAFLYNGAYTEE